MREFFQKYKLHIMIILAITIPLIIITSILIIRMISRKDEDSISDDFDEPSDESQLSSAEEAGKLLSHGVCEGKGSVTLSTSPMKEEDFAFLIPYGLVVGAHVTPIDHQYFSPTDFYSARDTYEVYAMADGKIVDIARRKFPPETDEYRIVFSHSCTFFTYYDLVTSLAPNIKSEFDKAQSNNYATVDIQVKEGDVIGFIGGRTLDFAVWNTEKPLTGFIVPEHYASEAWKIYTADPYDYYSVELKTMLTNKNLRTAEPIAGKIDYDIDGKLIGNWFEEGSNGYAGNSENYYSTHLSISPEHLDPTGTIISIGDFAGEAKQFAAASDAPKPQNVGVDSGLVKYELLDFEYVKPDGSRWDRNSLMQNLKVKPTTQSHGCVLFELVEDRRLKMEAFPRKTCSTVSGFSAGAKFYER